MVQISIIGILLIALVLYYFHSQKKEDEYKQAYGELQHLRAESSDLENQNALQKQFNKELLEENSILQQKAQKAKSDYEDATLKAQSLKTVISEQQDLIDSKFQKLEQEKQTNLELRLKHEEELVNTKILNKRIEAQFEIEEWEEKAKDARQKYLSVMEVLRSQQETEQTHILQIPQDIRDDIQYLIETVVPRMNNKEIINKLIWTEYISNASKDMLDAILPSKECSGIYKITNINNKKSYIGRSTNVYKRLQDHIKSSCGISTIADQKVHHAMRDEGLWNFQFELLEECEKSKLGEREKYYIEFFQTNRLGYNAVAGSAYKE